jgi:hypothetical protein
VASFTTDAGKRFEQLHQLVLKANTVAVLLNTVNSAGYDISSSPRPQRGPRHS